MRSRLRTQRRSVATALLAAARQRVDEVNEAWLCDTDELKWADIGHLIVRRASPPG